MENFLKIIFLLTTALPVVISCPGRCTCLPAPGGGTEAICVSAGLTSIPEDFWSFTTHLYLSGNMISVINASDFLNLRQLVTLDLSSNVIEHIDKTAFHPLTKLTYLNLESNKIYSLEVAHFQSLVNLETLNIGSNSDLVIHGPCTLSNLMNLKKFSLKHSPVTFGLYLFGNTTSCSEYNCNTLTGSSLCHLPVLDELDISYTATGKVPVELFGLTPSLRIISLAGNKVREIPDGSFYDLVSLEELTLNYNNLTYVHRGTFNGTTSLVKLELGNEYLVVDPDSFDDMPNLSELSLTLLGQSVIDSLAPVLGNIGISKLNLHHNFLTSVPASMSHISTLISLDLSQNLIAYLPGREFSTKLTELDLSSNVLANLDEDAFWGLTRIETLSLSDNRLQTVPSFVFASLPSSAKIFMGNNPWICGCEMKDVIADVRHENFPYPICSSPSELKGRPFSSLSDTDICPVTTVTQANPTTKQTTEPTTTMVLPKSTPSPILTIRPPGTISGTQTNRKPSTQVTTTPKTETSTPSTTTLTSTPSTTISSRPKSGTTIQTEPKRSTLRTLPHKTDFSTISAGSTSHNTVLTITLVTVLILIPAVIILSIFVVCLYIRQHRKPSPRVGSTLPTTHTQFREGGTGQNGHLPKSPIETQKSNDGTDLPPFYEEIPNIGMNDHIYLQAQPNSYLIPNSAPIAISEPVKNPNLSVISHSNPHYQPPPPYVEMRGDVKPAAEYETRIVNENHTNHYDRKISEL
ncbi:Leucine-rich repeat-containing protein 15 [Holothuria leucospilota]|uniref:Leucine-rich repeat-containing protein 15 n=1 Tax=Holothuria leucospilota TaxID=206669 RepID=A0A9Q0YNA8_HOLLE|nr:Leucine-rich repeat-containing protein 15 [Holothuria leucospilota]